MILITSDAGAHRGTVPGHGHVRLSRHATARACRGAAVISACDGRYEWVATYAHPSMATDKKFNPSGEYKLEIATLWRDLEITMGSEELAFRAAKRCPALLNPQYSNRWVFFRSKDLVTRTLGSERKAIDLFLSDPSLLQAAQYDGLNPKLEKMLSTVDPGSTSPNAPTPIMNTAALLGSVTFVVLVALVTSEKFLPS